MRIVAGTYGGRRIAAPRGAVTRPTGDRVREALFSMLGPLDGASVLDVFAGSGALGLEALSRGARRCVFSDTGQAATRAIRANLATLGVTEAVVLERDAVAVLREEVRAGRRHDLILLDPPYERWAELEPLLAGVVAAALTDTGIVVVETDAAVNPSLPLALRTSRRYGSARLTLFDHPGR